MHLLETFDKNIKFNTQNIINNIKNIEIFPVYKYNPIWKGIAKSYKNLIYNAKRCNFDLITICEDTCIFPQNFINKYNIINEFLSKINWDIFIGFNMDLENEIDILEIYKYKNITFFKINIINNTIFNIYNKTSYDNIIDRDINNSNSNNNNNSIDKYLKTLNITFITTYPFYFDYNTHIKCDNKLINIFDNKIKCHTNNIIYL